MGPRQDALRMVAFDATKLVIAASDATVTALRLRLGPIASLEGRNVAGAAGDASKPALLQTRAAAAAAAAKGM